MSNDFSLLFRLADSSSLCGSCLILDGDGNAGSFIFSNKFFGFVFDFELDFNVDERAGDWNIVVDKSPNASSVFGLDFLLFPLEFDENKSPTNESRCSLMLVSRFRLYFWLTFRLLRWSVEGFLNLVLPSMSDSGSTLIGRGMNVVGTVAFEMLSFFILLRGIGVLVASSSLESVLDAEEDFELPSDSEPELLLSDDFFSCFIFIFVFVFKRLDVGSFLIFTADVDGRESSSSSSELDFSDPFSKFKFLELFDRCACSSESENFSSLILT